MIKGIHHISMKCGSEEELDKVKDMVGEEGRKQIEKDILIKKALEFAADNAKEIKK